MCTYVHLLALLRIESHLQESQDTLLWGQNCLYWYSQLCATGSWPSFPGSWMFTYQSSRRCPKTVVQPLYPIPVPYCSGPIQPWRIEPESDDVKITWNYYISLVCWELKFGGSQDEFASLCFRGASYKMEVVIFTCLTKPGDTASWNVYVVLGHLPFL